MLHLSKITALSMFDAIFVLKGTKSSRFRVGTAANNQPLALAVG